jgi:hypothetical protein
MRGLTETIRKSMGWNPRRAMLLFPLRRLQSIRARHGLEQPAWPVKAFGFFFTPAERPDLPVIAFPADRALYGRQRELIEQQGRYGAVSDHDSWHCA